MSVLLQVRVTRAFRQFGEMSGLRAFGSVPVDKWTIHRESRKRYFCEVLQLGFRQRKPGSASRERKRIRFYGERRPRRQPVQRLSCRGNTRSFSEMTEVPLMKCPQEMSPAPKRRRINTGEAVKTNEAPRTSAVDPAPELRVQRRRWNLRYSKTVPVTEDEVTEAEKVSHKKTWITGSSYIHHDGAEDTEAPGTSAVDPAPELRVKRRSWNLSYSKTSPVTKEKVTERKVSHKKIWIIGSSYIHRGEKASFDCFGQNFGLNAKVEWFGKGGLRWSGVLPRFYSELSTQSPPDILVVHAGGNDLGLVPAKKLGVEITRGLMQLHKDCPSMRILFSCINERQAWRYGEPRVINGDRRTVNQLMTRAVHHFGGEVVQHPLLRFFKKKLYLPDGVHFTQEGNHIFLSVIHGVLRKMLL
ncbi:uncharacterized protein LOC118101452 [Hippoglossus stenolepis]|uniref:uncharacterized protein LOC118101452 n=1 Tax=Hippoglossus stenolepis TaxID=195615 RepID=UPI001FAFB0ED|nr:uncharacterized protein LOC118101452 [Hippoglossus stenolepis]